MTIGGLPPSRAPGRRPVAVTSDGSDFRRDPGSSVLTSLLSAAALLRERAGLAATAVRVTAGDERELIAELRRLAPGVRGVYLVHTDAARARAAQVALAGALPVVTEEQTTAIAVTAALLTVLGRAGVAPGEARVMIVGTGRDTVIAGLVAAAGIGEISRWRPSDAQDFPLRTLTHRADVVIDLLGVTADRLATPAAAHRPPVVTTDDAVVPLLAVAGLLAAAELSAHPTTLAECLATALALVARTPDGPTLPRLSNRRTCDDSGAADGFTQVRSPTVR